MDDFTITQDKDDFRKFNKGRPKGTTSKKNYLWKVNLYDKDTHMLKCGKFSTIKELNEEWNLKLNADYVKRIMTKYRADTTMRNKENSFLARYGHINIEKIKEPRI